MHLTATVSRVKTSAPFTILIVDDNRDFVEFLKLLLSHDGFSVLSAFNGPDGLEHARDHANVDLVILDVMMPEMDGLTACREFKRMRPSLPVILLTAKDDISIRAKAIALGVCEFLAKPVNIDDLLTRVRTQCQISQWDKELDVAISSKA